MNIAFITAELPYPDNSGSRRYTWERIKMLKKYGNKISLYSFYDEIPNNEDIKTIRNVCLDIKIYPRQKVSLLDKFNILKPYTALSRYSKKLEEDLKLVVSKKNVDVVIVDVPQLLYNVLNLKDVVVVSTQHNIEYRSFLNIAQKTQRLDKKLEYYFEGIKLKLFENRTYKSGLINGYTFISTKDKSIFESMYPGNRVDYVPMGISLKSNIDENKPRNNSIVFVGKMSYFPNEEAAIWFCNDIFPEIKRKFKDIKLYLVGKEPSDRVLKFANESIVVTGMVDEVNSYLDFADIVVIPLLSGGGVKIKLLEALSRNKIVITTSKGNEGTEFKDKEHVLVADSASEFVTTCINVLENLDKYSYLIDNSRKIMEEKYSWDSIGEKYNNFLKELL